MPPSAVLTAVNAGLAGLAGVANESQATGQLARNLAASAGTQKIWVAAGHHASLPAAMAKANSFGATLKSYDLATASTAAAARPSRIVQVKWRHGGSEVQGLHLFLGDIAVAAVDAHVQGTTGTKPEVFGVSAMPTHHYTASAYWRPYIEPMVGVAKLILNPCAAAATALNATVAASAWLDVANRTIRPITRPQINRIFSAGTNAKYLGLFSTPGRLVVDLAIERFAGTENSGFVVRVTGLSLEGVARGMTVQKWWP